MVGLTTYISKVLITKSLGPFFYLPILTQAYTGFDYFIGDSCNWPLKKIGDLEGYFLRKRKRMGGEVAVVVDFFDTYNDYFVRSNSSCSFFIALVRYSVFSFLDFY